MNTTADNTTIVQNLLARIRNKVPEDVTTEVLAYLLEKFPLCRSGFLSLIDPSIQSQHCGIETQLDLEDGRPDLALRDENEQWIVFVENKPWVKSTFTKGDQLKRYAVELRGHTIPNKNLCLLVTENNKRNLLREAAAAEGSDIDADDLKQHYRNNCGIDFAVITWEQVLATLEDAEPKNAAIGLLSTELREFLFPPRFELSAEALEDKNRITADWRSIRLLVAQAKELAERHPKMDGHRFAPARGNPQDHAGFYGCYIYSDRLNYWCGVYPTMWEDFSSRIGKHNFLFVLHVRFKKVQGSFRNSIDKKPVIADPLMLKEFGFEYDPVEWEYVYPLVDASVDQPVTAEMIADGLVDILCKINDALGGNVDQDD